MTRKLITLSSIVVATIALTAGAAFAHVTIEGDGPVAPDGMVRATLSVPNEQDDAGTVKIELVFPPAPVISTATADPVTGWTASVTKTPSGAVERVTWTGGPLTGENRVNLPLTLGPIYAGAETINLSALQTYDNGDISRWIDPPLAGGAEPEHPAPVLTVTGAPPASTTTTVGPTSTTTAPVTSAPADAKSSSDDGLSTAAVVAIVVGAAVVLGGGGYVITRARRRQP